MAWRLDVEVLLVDVGVAGDLSAAPTAPRHPLRPAKVRAGTANLCREPAMRRDEAERALAVGAACADELIAAGHRLLAVGEIGIANTTAAAALVCAFTGAAPPTVVGRGTGVSDETWRRKVAVVEAALTRHRGVVAAAKRDPLGALAALGGLELAAIAGFCLAAARAHTPVVLDGFLTAASALVAATWHPTLPHGLLLSHASVEPGAALAASALGLRPLLDLELRLGEGTGAVLAVELVRTALHLERAMSPLATAGIQR
jgi:nicotinate-nucleotide--dimethylbenzimidazole phosphoribosyltransferase